MKTKNQKLLLALLLKNAKITKDEKDDKIIFISHLKRDFILKATDSIERDILFKLFAYSIAPFE